jgi:hypothetical protein
MAEETKGYKTVSREEFDKLAKNWELWSEGPEVETRTRQYGAPYCPGREVRGVLKDGRKLRAVI